MHSERPPLRVVITDAAHSSLLDLLRELLNAGFDGDFTDDDWGHTQGGLRVVALLDEEPVGHVAVVPRSLYVGGRRLQVGYVEGVVVHPSWRRRGIGSELMRAAERELRERFEMGALSSGAHGFYERLGWERWRGPTWVLEAAAPRRTATEDDGVMVLRYGASEGVELTESIACEPRAGDDW